MTAAALIPNAVKAFPASYSAAARTGGYSALKDETSKLAAAGIGLAAGATAVNEMSGRNTAQRRLGAREVTLGGGPGFGPTSNA